jgi:predicted metal-dependent hydrolase
MSYTVMRSKRRTRGVSIRVHHSGHIEVRAPQYATDHDIQNIVNSRKHWIKAKLEAFKQSYADQPHQFIAGEQHYLLGKPLTLYILSGERKQTSVQFLDASIQINTQDPSPEKVKKVINKAYSAFAREYFEERIKVLSDTMHWVKGDPPLKVRAMKRRWGSCSHDGRINLNTHLIKAPPQCVDSVIVHELCHIKEHNHSPRFYALMTQVMPEWKQHKQQLESLSHCLLMD